jgi:hypothetical protein
MLTVVLINKMILDMYLYKFVFTSINSDDFMTVTLDIGTCFRRVIHPKRINRCRYHGIGILKSGQTHRCWYRTVSYWTFLLHRTKQNKIKSTGTTFPLLKPMICSCTNKFQETFVTIEYSDRPPLLVQRCNGTTAGLGYLEV